jgi:hypothetical protein
VSANLKEVFTSLNNVIPIKAYDGNRSKNSTLMNLATYLINYMYNVRDVS